MKAQSLSSLLALSLSVLVIASTSGLVEGWVIVTPNPTTSKAPTSSLSLSSSSKQNAITIRPYLQRSKRTSFLQMGTLNDMFGGDVLSESKIPEDLKEEIYKIEGNTPAAKDRQLRIYIYGAIALLGTLLALLNVYLSNIRAGTDEIPAMPLDEAGFGWVQSNFFFSFFLTNKIGGFLVLLSAGASALLVETEFDSKNINSEKIYDELVRRRGVDGAAAALKGTGGPPIPKVITDPTELNQKKKKKRTGKSQKRIAALTELTIDTVEEKSDSETKQAPAPVPEKVPEPAEEQKKGIFDQIKGFYDKADSMAASQALLLNKKLEDAGVLDKITDESGLRVIGKDEASKLEDGNSSTEGEKQDGSPNTQKKQ